MNRPVGVQLRRAIVAAALVIALAVAGCGGNGGSGGSEGATEAPAKAGGTLRVALESEPSTLNPFQVIEQVTAYVIPQVMETLYTIGPDGKPQPNLATKATTSKDGLTWTLQLREGVKFSDGSPMTAADVAFSLNELRTGPYFAGLFEPIEKVSAASPTTVTIKTSKPMPALLGDLGLFVAGVVPDNYGGVSEKEFAQEPVGTGAFALSSWKHGQAITLVPNKQYWRKGQPLLDQIVYTFTTDENARLAQLRGGETDFSRATPLTVKSGLSNAPDVRVEENPSVFVDYLLLNQNDPAFKDPRVREAVNLAIDREGMITAGTDGKGTLGASFLPPSVTYADDSLQPPAQDVAGAKKLLGEAVKDGVDPSFTIKFYSFDSFSKIATQIAQQDLEEAGFDVKLQALDEAALNSQIEAGEYEAVLGLYLPWIADPSELTSFYLAFYGTNSGADVEAQTALAAKANTELDPAKREQLFIQLQQMVADEESMLILNYQPIVTAVSDELSGFYLNPFGFVAFNEAGFAG